MVKTEFNAINKEALVSISNEHKNKIKDIAKKYNVTVKQVLNIIIKECKMLMTKSDAASKTKFNYYRDLIIGNYTLYLIKLYNSYAKRFSMDANDFMHIPYENFENFVKNYDESAGVNFYSFMMLSVQGYILKFINTSELVHPNVALKVRPVYCSLTKKMDDGTDTDYLSVPEEFDFDIHGKLDFIRSILHTLPPEMRELYNDMAVADFPYEGYHVYCDRHGCKYAHAKQIAKRMKAIIVEKWNEYKANH